ncbi:uncharacterized protein LOC128234677 [Mya arenaria]|uniref:uncharacterized protein LOC128234677 n=1 Tax=Mya arenaria TaxID=6604 RepID=UPI0022E4A2B8|nr:uncharacterized protein LOC128234677 [Mya arenaria]
MNYLFVSVFLILSWINVVACGYDNQPPVLCINWLQSFAEQKTFIEARDFLGTFIDDIDEGSIVKIDVVYEKGNYRNLTITKDPTDAKWEENLLSISNVGTGNKISAERLNSNFKQCFHKLSRIMPTRAKINVILTDPNVEIVGAFRDENVKTYVVLTGEERKDKEPWPAFATDEEHVFYLNESNRLRELLNKDAQLLCGIHEYMEMHCTPCSDVCHTDGHEPLCATQYKFVCKYYLQHLYEVAKTEATANHDATRGTTPARQNVINDAKQPRYDKVELTAVILPIVIGIVAVIAVVAGVYWRKCRNATHRGDAQHDRPPSVVSSTSRNQSYLSVATTDETPSRVGDSTPSIVLPPTPPYRSPTTSKKTPPRRPPPPSDRSSISSNITSPNPPQRPTSSTFGSTTGIPVVQDDDATNEEENIMLPLKHVLKEADVWGARDYQPVSDTHAGVTPVQ